MLRKIIAAAGSFCVGLLIARAIGLSGFVPFVEEKGAFAGDPRAALPHLEAASVDCGALLTPTYHFQNLLRLGAAREALGERDAACTAYQAILARWGRAAESSTAREASRRASALGCGASRGPR